VGRGSCGCESLVTSGRDAPTRDWGLGTGGGLPPGAGYVVGRGPGWALPATHLDWVRIRVLPNHFVIYSLTLSRLDTPASVDSGTSVRPWSVRFWTQLRFLRASLGATTSALTPTPCVVGSSVHGSRPPQPLGLPFYGLHIANTTANRYHPSARLPGVLLSARRRKGVFVLKVPGRRPEQVFDAL
jgi:hypothetical protein